MPQTPKFEPANRRGRLSKAGRHSRPSALRATSLAAIGGLLAIAGGSNVATAETADERVEVLEERLDQAIGTIEALKQEVEQLRGAQPRATQSAAPQTPVAGPNDKVVKVVDDVEERVTDLEDQVLSVEERLGNRPVVRAFDALELDIGGFVHLAATHASGDDGSATSVNRQIFELLAKATIDEDWDIFLAQAFLRQSGIVFDDPAGRSEPNFDVSTGTDTVIAWANYRHSDALNVRLGRFTTPHGIINIEHFPALLLDPEQPQFLRPFSGDTIFPNFTSGGMLHGRFFVGDEGRDRLQYYVYTGNFDGNSEALNAGGRAAYTFGDLGLTAGVNIAHGEREDEPDAGYEVYGADLLYDAGPILWKSEIYFTNETLGEDRFAAYTQPAWRFAEDWTAFYRFDYLDNGAGVGESIEHALGLSFRPNPNVHLRVVGTRRDTSSGGGLPEADLETVQMSATFSF